MQIQELDKLAPEEVVIVWTAGSVIGCASSDVCVRVQLCDAKRFPLFPCEHLLEIAHCIDSMKRCKNNSQSHEVLLLFVFVFCLK